MAYSTEANVRSEFGKDNVDRWAAVLSTDGSTEITTNVEYAIATVDALIDGQFQGGPYTVPFSPVPTLVQRWSAKLAGVELYRKRGQRDDDAVGDKLTDLETDVWRQMRMYVSGSLRLPSSTPSSHTGPTTPVVVTGSGVYAGRRLDGQVNPYAPWSRS